MNPDEKKLLERTLQLSVENNLMLHKIQRGLRWARAVRVVYWLGIVAVSLGAYYLVQPYVDQIKGLYSGFGGGIEEIREGTVK